MLEPLHSPATMEAFAMVKDELKRRLYGVYFGIFARNPGVPSPSLAASSACCEVLKKVGDRIRYVQQRKAEAALREH